MSNELKKIKTERDDFFQPESDSAPYQLELDFRDARPFCGIEPLFDILPQDPGCSETRDGAKAVS